MGKTKEQLLWEQENSRKERIKNEIRRKGYKSMNESEGKDKEGRRRRKMPGRRKEWREECYRTGPSAAAFRSVTARLIGCHWSRKVGVLKREKQNPLKVTQGKAEYSVSILGRGQRGRSTLGTSEWRWEHVSGSASAGESPAKRRGVGEDCWRRPSAAIEMPSVVLIRMLRGYERWEGK